jgi:hypothetical protein
MSSRKRLLVSELAMGLPPILMYLKGTLFSRALARLTERGPSLNGELVVAPVREATSMPVGQNSEPYRRNLLNEKNLRRSGTIESAWQSQNGSCHFGKFRRYSRKWTAILTTHPRRQNSSWAESRI